MFKHRPRRRAISFTALMILGVTAMPGLTQENNDEIIRLRGELSRQQAECRRKRTEIEKEKKEFDAYRAAIASRIKEYASGINALDKDIAAADRRNDSLTAAIQTCATHVRQLELGNVTLRGQLASLCDIVDTAAVAMAPMISQPLHGAIALLKSDLTATTVDNMEACNRLAQILNQIEEATGSIQTTQTASFLPDIPGVAYRLRIGSSFEAVVNEKATRAAIWRLSTPGITPQWEVVTDAAIAAKLLKAVNVREGKSIPAIVALPVNGADMKGQMP